MSKGVYGAEKLKAFNDRFWACSLRGRTHERIYNQLKKAPQHTQGSRLVGRIYLNSELDKFTLSDRIAHMGWRVDLCLHSFLREHEHRVRGTTRDRNEYESPHMTVRIPKNALERIRRVVKTYWVTNPGMELHICKKVSRNHRHWKLGSFKGATELYSTNMTRIPAEGLSFEQSQKLIEWKRAGPNDARPFVCACGEAKVAQQGEEAPADGEASPDDL
ncbi:hypothetical protein PG997_001652 [Apiospora hydei]|uniref:Uncharacterized protein n=1 Tax=Apiospora hydei TaxID=1337664 RepID=A0ABR1XEI2_9PEZI